MRVLPTCMFVMHENTESFCFPLVLPSCPADFPSPHDLISVLLWPRAQSWTSWQQLAFCKFYWPFLSHLTPDSSAGPTHSSCRADFHTMSISLTWMTATVFQGITLSNHATALHLHHLFSTQNILSAKILDYTFKPWNQLAPSLSSGFPSLPMCSLLQLTFAPLTTWRPSRLGGSSQRANARPGLHNLLVSPRLPLLHFFTQR